MLRKISKISDSGVRTTNSQKNDKLTQFEKDLIEGPWKLAIAEHKNSLLKTAGEKTAEPVAKINNGFLYAWCTMMHAAEASLIDQETGDFLKNAAGEPVVGYFEKCADSKGKDSVRWISPDGIKMYKNNNSDIFPEEDLKIAYKKWIKKPLCRDHVSNTVDGVRGYIIDTQYDPKYKRVYALFALDRVTYPDLAKKIEMGYVTSVSMGTGVARSICSECANVAQVESDYCDHVRSRRHYGEINKDLEPIELSIVVTGADPNAHIRTVLASLKKNAKDANTTVSNLIAQVKSLDASIEEITNEVREIFVSVFKEHNITPVNLSDEILDDLLSTLKYFNIQDLGSDFAKEKLQRITRDLDVESDESNSASSADINNSVVASSSLKYNRGAMSTFKNKLSEIEQRKAYRKAFLLGTEEDTHYAPMGDSDKIRDTQDKHMVGQTLDTKVENPDLEIKKKYLRARRRQLLDSINKNAAESAEVLNSKDGSEKFLRTNDGKVSKVDQAKDGDSKMNNKEKTEKTEKKDSKKKMSKKDLAKRMEEMRKKKKKPAKNKKIKNKKAFYLGTEEDPHYSPMGDSDKIRNTQDKHMVGQTLDTKVENPDLELKKKHLRADRLQANFVKGASPAKNKWVFKVDAKPVLSFTAENAYSDFLNTKLPNNKKASEYFASKEYASSVLKLIKSAGPVGAADELGIQPSAVTPAGAEVQKEMGPPPDMNADMASDKDGGEDEQEKALADAISNLDAAVADIHGAVQASDEADEAEGVAAPDMNAPMPADQMGGAPMLPPGGMGAPPAPKAASFSNEEILRVYANAIDINNQLVDIMNSGSVPSDLVTEALIDANTIIQQARKMSFALRKDATSRNMRTLKKVQAALDSLDDGDMTDLDEGSLDDLDHDTKFDDMDNSALTAEMDDMEDMEDDDTFPTDPAPSLFEDDMEDDDTMLADDCDEDEDDCSNADDDEMDFDEDDFLNDLALDSKDKKKVKNMAKKEVKDHKDDEHDDLEETDDELQDKIDELEEELEELKAQKKGKKGKKKEGDDAFDGSSGLTMTAAKRAARRAAILQKVAAKVPNAPEYSDLLKENSKGADIRLEGVKQDKDALRVENVAEIADAMRASVSKEAKVAAAMMDKLISTGSTTLEKLIATGAVDSEAVKYYKQYYGEVDGGKEYADGMVKEFKAKEVKASEEAIYRYKRAFNLAIEAQSKGMIDQGAASLNDYAEELSNIPEKQFSSVAKMVRAHKVASAMPTNVGYASNDVGNSFNKVASNVSESTEELFNDPAKLAELLNFKV